MNNRRYHLYFQYLNKTFPDSDFSIDELIMWTRDRRISSSIYHVYAQVYRILWIDCSQRSRDLAIREWVVISVIRIIQSIIHYVRACNPFVKTIIFAVLSENSVNQSQVVLSKHCCGNTTDSIYSSFLYWLMT